MKDICTFDNRVALVTGAAGNIGLAVCRRLADYGVRIAACDIDSAIVEERTADLRAGGADIRAYSMEVTSRESVFAAIGAAIKDFGKIDIIVNNAGVWNHRDVVGRQRFEEMDPVEWKRLLEIDVDGVFHCCQAILPHMLGRGYGRIVNTTSIAGEVGLPGYADYAAAKAGLIMFTKTLAMENAKKGITVNCVCPGVIKSDMNARFSEEEMKELAENTPVQRLGKPQDVAELIYYLASEKADFITGQDFSVDGGFGL